jgi:hypothetical protein
LQARALASGVELMILNSDSSLSISTNKGTVCEWCALSIPWSSLTC